MAQHDYNIANQALNAGRTDVNNCLLAVQSTNSGSSSPTATTPYMLWADTTNSVLKIRNSADNAWITKFKLDGVQQYASGNTASLPAFSKSDDTNTGIYFPSADTVGIVTGGTERLRVDSSGNVGIGFSSIYNNDRLYVNGKITAGDGGATNGVTILQGRYSEANNDYINILGSHYGTGAWVLGYAVRPKNGQSGFVSSVDNVSWARGALQTSHKLIFSNASPQNTTVGSDVIMTKRFEVDENGKVFMPSLATSGSGNPVHITSSGELWENGSSKRFKTNIENLKSIDSSLIYKLNVVEYDRVNEEGEAIPGTHEIGFIAEEVEEILPIIVNYDRKEKESDPKIPRGVDKSILIPLIITEMKKLKAEIKELKEKISDLEKK